MAGPDNGCVWPDLPEWRLHVGRDNSPIAQRFEARNNRIGSTGGRLCILPDPLPVRVWNDAAAIPRKRHAVVMLDPPYAGTAGYARRAVEDRAARALADEVATRWLRAGATVAVCETSHVGGGIVYDLDAREVRTTGARRAGANGKRTREVLTVLHPSGGRTLWDT